MGRKETKKLQQGIIAAQSEQKAKTAANEAQLQSEISGIPTDYTPEQKAAIRRARLSSIDEGYAGAGDEATRRYARTGATAGFSETLGELALQRTREKSRAGAELETGFADEPIRRRLLRAQLLQSIYGTNAGLYGQTLVYPNQQGSGWLSSLIGAGGAAGAAGIEAACWIAIALYGENHGKTLVLRYYVNEVWPRRVAGRVFRAVYVTIGQRVAGWVSAFRHLNVVMRKLFDALHRRAVAELEA